MPAFFALSLAAHAAALMGLSGEPQPAPSIGIPAISVEIVLGSETPAGLASLPQAFDAQAKAADSREEQTTRNAIELAARHDAAEPSPLEAEPEPQADSEPLEPLQPVKEKQPEARKPRQSAKPAAQRKTAGERPKPKASANNAASASGVGVGQSSADASYAARVAAHLARYKRFPPLALKEGARGTAIVAFTIDGAGRVTSVRLMRGAGAPSLDEEAQAMVRRASPVPAPPSGRAASLTLPVTFEVR